MSIKFYKECNYISEINDFLYSYFNNSSIKELHNELKLKSGYTKEVKKILTKMEIVYDEIVAQVQVPNTLSMYYESIQNHENGFLDTLANCMLIEGFFRQEENFDDLKEIMKKAFHQDRGRMFLDGMKKEIFLQEESETVLSKEEFFHFLDTDMIKEEMKWNVFKVYDNFDEHVDILLEAFKQMFPIFKSIYTKHEKEFVDFTTFWTQEETSGNIQKRLQEIASLNIEEKDIVLRPSWLGCNAIRMYQRKSGTGVLLFVGLLFTDYQFFHQEKVSDEEMCARLKLISDPSKYEILKEIKNEGKYGAQLAQHLDLSTATISHHMSTLINTGLVSIEKDVNRIYYHANKELLALCIDQLRRDLCED